ncbi:lipopolysaccharide heptosyltransferase I [Tepidamorphus sp. 3E244]|uniref:lipopolysaccharide heptosyltransferase I n=1 Tax=Tepidamorphus sp. 3E244 TaxID=3385498 RepID=UPI0038FC9965
MSKRILLVKLSSLGDVVHTYPALTDLARAVPGAKVDWVVEEAFAPLAALHPAVGEIFPVRLRALKKAGWRAQLAHLKELRGKLKGRYDLVIDAQGLMKSALVAKLAGARVAGYGRDHAREKLAAVAYRDEFDISVMQHAATRTRKLFADALGYDLEKLPLDHGLKVRNIASIGRSALAKLGITKPPAMILHGSAWHTKTWSPAEWRKVAEMIDARGVPLVVPAGSAEELETAQTIIDGLERAYVLPPLSLHELAGVLAKSRFVLGVDSGLTHLGVALNRPGVFLIGPTDPVRTGPIGDTFRTIVSKGPAAPCYKRTCDLTPDGRCCMDAIKRQDVLRAVEYALAAT